MVSDSFWPNIQATQLILGSGQNSFWLGGRANNLLLTGYWTSVEFRGFHTIEAEP